MQRLLLTVAEAAEALALSRSTIYRLLKDAGVPKLSIHALRHTFATICFLNEVPAEQVQTAAGHSSIRTTKDMYANYLPPLATKAIDALSKVLDPDTDQRHLEVVKIDERKGA